MSDFETSGIVPHEISAKESITLLDEVVDKYRHLSISWYPHKDLLHELAKSAGYQLTITRNNNFQLDSQKGITTEYAGGSSALHLISSLVVDRISYTGELCATQAIRTDYPEINLVTVDPYLVIGAHLQHMGVQSSENSDVYGYNSLAQRVRMTRKILEHQMPSVANELQILDLGGSSGCIYIDKQKQYIYKVYAPTDYTIESEDEIEMGNFSNTEHALSLMKKDIQQTAFIGRLGIGPKEFDSAPPREENGYVIPAVVRMEYVDIGYLYDIPHDQFVTEAHKMSEILATHHLRPAGALEIHWDKRKNRLQCVDLVEMEPGTLSAEELFEEIYGQYEDSVNRKARYKIID